jgi:integrase
MHSTDALAAVTFRTAAPEHRAAVNPTLAELIDAYMLAYTGRDRSRSYRVEVWVARLGARPTLEITDDEIFFELERLGAEPALTYVGRDAHGHPIHRMRASRKSPGTVNRFRDALSGVYNWAIRTRRLPKGTGNPCRAVAKHPEHPGIVRFLDEDKRTRLLAACRTSSWPRLYALVLMALTTGGRRSELLGLRWRYVNLERRQACVTHTKNGEAKVLPLTKAVVDQFTRFRGEDAKRFKLGLAGTLLFHSERKPNQAFHFEEVWLAALKQEQVKHFRFHDLRHSCASYLAQSGASLIEIADVLGHKSLSMVRRYSHLSAASKAALIDKVLGDIG